MLSIHSLDCVTQVKTNIFCFLSPPCSCMQSIFCAWMLGDSVKYCVPGDTSMLNCQDICSENETDVHVYENSESDSGGINQSFQTWHYESYLLRDYLCIVGCLLKFLPYTYYMSVVPPQIWSPKMSLPIARCLLYTSSVRVKLPDGFQ